MSDQTRIRIFCVDDHPLLREGIAAIINNQPDMPLVAEAATGFEAIQKFQQRQPDITFMDLRLPDMSGIDALIAIRTELAEARIIMLTTFEGDAESVRHKAVYTFYDNYCCGHCAAWPRSIFARCSPVRTPRDHYSSRFSSAEILMRWRWVIFDYHDRGIPECGQ